MKSNFNVFDFFIVIGCILAGIFLIDKAEASDDQSVWLYYGGWSHHASGVSYSTQTHNTVGIEYKDWVYWQFTNSNEDESFFAGKAVEFGKLTNNVHYGAMFGCVQGYTDECLPVIMPTLTYQMRYLAVDLVYMPGVVYKAALRVPLFTHKEKQPDYRDNVGDFQISYTVGSGGLGGGARYYLNDGWAVSLKHTQYDLEPSWGTAEIEFTTLAVDWHPFENGFFVSAGLTNNKTHADYYKEWSKTFEVLEYSATITASAEAEIEYAPVAGYFGFGYEYRPEKAHDLGYRLELGVVAAGNPEVNGTARVHGIDELDELAQAVADRKLAEIREDYGYAYWPVAEVSITYNF